MGTLPANAGDPVGTKVNCFAGAGILLAAALAHAGAAVHYVDAGGTNAVPPFGDWSTAATNIQDAIDAAVDGDSVLVTNGVYAGGGRVIYGSLTNRVALNKAVTVQSVNGPAVTVIQGYQNLADPFRLGSVRCAYLTNGALLAGFTLTDSSTQLNWGNFSEEQSGGAVWCESTAATVSNCVVSSGWAAGLGGGAYSGTLLNCQVSSNFAVVYGGGTYYSTVANSWLLGNTSVNVGGGAYSGGLSNCTLIGNSSGAAYAALNNCIIYYNTSFNTTGSGLSYCCTFPDPGGTGNFTNEPHLADFAHLSASSPCVGAGSAGFAAGTDIDGEPWRNPPAIGCDDYYAGGITGLLSAGIQAEYTNAATGFTVHFAPFISGHASANAWDFGDGTVVSNQLYAVHSWQTAGDFPVTFRVYNETYPAGISAIQVVHIFQETHYVDLNSPGPAPPYDSWATAATNIQDALDAVFAPGAQVWVTNGVYRTGGRVVSGLLSNRVAITLPVVLQSVNGPQVTTICGYQVPGTRFGDSAVRCVYLTNRAALLGFTLTNGATRAAGDAILEQSGGGIFCPSADVLVSNCVLVANAAGGGGGGGGIFSGTLYDCQLIRNAAPNGYGGGAYSSEVNHCVLAGNSASAGGGAAESAMSLCWLTNNTAGGGGGTYGYTAVLHNCLLTGNSAGTGGGALGGSLINCTIVSNTATATGGGAWNSGAANSILYYNSAPKLPNWDGGSYAFCCTTPAYDYGAFTDPPQFVNLAGGDFHLQTNSPCVNAGDNSPSNPLVDLDGNPRFVAGYIDIGAFELQTAQPPSAFATVDFTNLLTGFAASFQAGYYWGRATSATWDFGDGVIVSNTLTPTHAWTSVGDYPVIAQVYAPNNPAGLTATVTVHVATQIIHYVNANGTNPVAPYFSWATAATNIQDAVDVAVPAPGSHVIVTNGVYGYGGRVVHGAMTNRLAVTKPIVVQSVNGPGVTTIQGYQVPGALAGDSAVRCVYLTTNAVLSGFTLTGGATRRAGATVEEQSGGGIWCADATAGVSNCVLVGNGAVATGGGASGGTFFNCSFTSNQVVYTAGGGVEGANLNNCVLTGNSSGGNGGGADQCNVYSCELFGNTAAASGGGSSAGTLNDCTLTGNSAGVAGGGSFGGALTNCIVYYNHAPAGTNYSGGTLSYCCALPLPAGAGNLSAEPQVTDAGHIAANSPCRGGGISANLSGADIDGESWLNPPSIGCDEYYAGTVVGPLSVVVQADYTNVATGFPVNFGAAITGRASLGFWTLDDGSFQTNRPILSRGWTVPGDYSVVFTAVNDTNPGGVSATSTVHVVSQPVQYVAASGSNPVAPYISWATAATNIQDAIDVGFEGGTILVSNGVYQTGGRVVYGFLTNRVAVNRTMTIQSINGPAATVIQGNAVLGDGAVRCVYLVNNTVLQGFTLAGGATRNSGDVTRERSGGGAWCQSAYSLLLNCLSVSNSAAWNGGGVFSGACSNCVFTFNSAVNGGGAFGGLLINCALSTNSATTGGGAYSNVLNNCVLAANKTTGAGAGAYGSQLFGCTVSYCTNSAGGAGISLCAALNCVLSNNVATPSAGGGGGGAANSTLTNCLVANNSAGHGGGANSCFLTNCVVSGNLASDSQGGGGAALSTLFNCIVTANRATVGLGGGGGNDCTFNNCVVSSNSAPNSSGAYGSTLNNCTIVGHTNSYAIYACTLRNSVIYYNTTNFLVGVFSNCCTVPLPSGAANFTNAPLFANLALGDFHLQTNSPCINAGNNRYVTTPTDLDGNLRIQGGTVDLGAYEFQFPTSLLSYQWLQLYGLPTDGSADLLDTDGDGMNNWQEWVAGTNPTNPASALRLGAPVPNAGGLRVSWQSVSGKTYFLQRSTNVAVVPAFSAVWSNIGGLAGTTYYTDTTATNAGPYFYRLGVQ